MWLTSLVFKVLLLALPVLLSDPLGIKFSLVFVPCIAGKW